MLQEALASGRLDTAFDLLAAAVRNAPEDVPSRNALFQVMLLRGEWDRAEKQLEVVQRLVPAHELQVMSARLFIQCERSRERVYAGESASAIFGEPDAWMAELVEAFRLVQAGQLEEAERLRDRAFDAAPPVSGTVNDTAFEWIADSDTRLGPMLEAFVEGRYLWVPFSRIHRIETQPPVEPKDLLWATTEFTWTNGGRATGIVPARYVGTAGVEPVDLVMARRTEWESPGGTHQFARGQRMIATDVDDHPWLEIRTLELAPLETGAAAADGKGAAWIESQVPGGGADGAEIAAPRTGPGDESEAGRG